MPTLGIAAIVLLALVTSLWVLRRRNASQRRLEQALEKVSMRNMSDFVIPDGMGGHIHIDRLLLTPRGLLVLDVKKIKGVIFGSDKMDNWTVIDGKQRFEFRNPQGPLYDRVAAVRQLAQHVPVEGLILFSDDGEFTKGIPRSVTSPQTLIDTYHVEDSKEAEKLIEAFFPYWERITRSANAA
jgi:hypothetical protein